MAQFRTFWHGGDLPSHVKICLSSFVEHGHELDLFCYRPISVPRGVTLRDASEIISESNVFYYWNADGSRGSVSAFSNLFRYELLARFGGWWVDTDVYCLRDELPPGEIFIGWEDAKKICTAIMKFPEAHPLIGAALEVARQKSGDKLVWGETGPNLVTELAQKMSITHLTFPPSYAYPLHWREFEMIVKLSETHRVEERIKGLPFLHIWNEMFRRSEGTPLEQPETGSFWGNKAKLLMC